MERQSIPNGAISKHLELLETSF